MFTIIGILFLLLTFVSIYFLFTVRREESTDSYGDPVEASPEIIQKLASVKVTVASFFIAIILLFGVNGAFFVADGTEQYGVQYLWGTKVAVREPGLRFKGWGKIIPLGNEIVVKYAIPSDKDGSMPENSEFSTVIPAQEWEFNDAVKGEVAATVVVNTRAMDDEQFLELVFNVRSEKNLVYSRILPAMNASLKNAAKLMGAQDYMSGKSSDFDYYFKDQLNNGAYRLKEENVKTGNKQTVLDSVATTVGADVIAEDAQPKSKVYRILERGGVPVRQTKNTVFSKYNIQVITAVAEDVDWENKFDERLDAQKALVADIQKAKRGAEKEYYERLQAEQKGEKEKVQEQKKLEKEQIQKTVAAETKVLEAEQLVKEETYKKQAATIAAQTLKITKDAEAYANKKLVQAGLTPQERAQIEKEIAIGVAKELAKLDLPETVILGSGKNGDDGLISQLLGAKIAESMINTKAIGKGSGN